MPTDPAVPGHRRLPRISLRCTDLPPVPVARHLGLAADSDRPQAEAAKSPQRAGASFALLQPGMSRAGKGGIGCSQNVLGTRCDCTVVKFGGRVGLGYL